MAQAKPRNLNTIISKFYGGMSNDDYVGQADQSGEPMCFYDGSGIEISKQAKYIELSQNYNSLGIELGTTSIGNIVSFISTNTTQQAICASQGGVYNWNGVLKFTADHGIVNAFTSGGYGHLIKTNGKIDRWILSSSDVNNDTGISASVSQNYADVGATLIGNNPYIIDSGFLYVANGNVIYKLDLTVAGYPSVKILTVDIGFVIKAITQIGDQFYIYASDGSIGIQYLWTGSNITTGGNLSKIRWYDKPIINVANINNIDYVVIGNSTKRALYIVSGYLPKLLIQSKYIKNTYNDKFIFRPEYVNGIETVDNLIFIPADGCIYTYGRINPDLPNACIRKITIDGLAPTTLATDNFGNFNLYYFYEKGGKIYKGTQYLVENNYGLDPGTIIFNPIISNIYSSKDGALKTRIGYDLPTTDCKINIYFKPDYQGGYANFYVNSFDGTHYPAIGDTYTFNTKTYTVYAITNTIGNANGIVHCTYTEDVIDIGQINERGTSGTMTKATGTGPNFTFYRITRGMKLAGTITDTTEHKELFAAEDPCYQMTFMLDLITTNVQYSPRIWDFVYAYQEIENDI